MIIPCQRTDLILDKLGGSKHKLMEAEQMFICANTWKRWQDFQTRFSLWYSWGDQWQEIENQVNNSLAQPMKVAVPCSPTSDLVSMPVPFRHISLPILSSTLFYTSHWNEWEFLLVRHSSSKDGTVWPI